MLPAGTVAYTLGHPPVVGTGLAWSEQETEQAVMGPVASVVYDDAGTQSLASLLSGLPETGFTSIKVQATLSQTAVVENWRVGEALAKGCPELLAIELLAIYLPEASIETLGTLAAQSRKGGGS